MSFVFRRMWAALTASVAIVALAMAVAPESASAHPASLPRDTATVSALRLPMLLATDVIAGSAGNDLIVRYTAGSTLVDGTVQVTFPVAQWPTPMYPVAAADSAGESPGAVFVRPAPLNGSSAMSPDPTIGAGLSCGWPANTPVQWSVEKENDAQVVVVQHVDCAPGQSLTVWVNRAAAPAQVGRYVVPVQASSEVGGRRRPVLAALQVKPQPRVALHIDAGPEALIGTPTFFVRITALHPNGRVDTRYRGAIAMSSDDCTMSPAADTVAYQFTAASAGVVWLPVEFSLAGTHELRVYDIANRALPAQTDVQVTGDPIPVICPVSYN